jgi:ABC-2 type transport system ATP-binding protein
MSATSDVVARLSGVVKRYGSLTALDGVDLVLHRGELLAVLGPNGAGKSTSISLLLGLIRPDGGRVELFGRDPQQIEARQRIGVMLQSAMLPLTLRVAELLRLVASYYPHPRSLEESANLAGIGDLLQRPYGKLSGGQQRRVQFALALCGRPELVFLDEPTVGMDIDARQKLWAAMRALVAEGCSVVLTTHYLEEAEALAQRVVVMGKGRVLSEGSVDALRAQVPLTRIRCVTDLDAATVAGWPQVAAAEREGARLRISTSAAENVLRRLLDADAALRELEVQRAGLAEAFTELTREDSVIEQEAA